MIGGIGAAARANARRRAGACFDLDQIPRLLCSRRREQRHFAASRNRGSTTGGGAIVAEAQARTCAAV